MDDLLIGLALVVAGVGAFGAQQYILRRNTLREERRDRQAEYLVNAYRALYRLQARMERWGEDNVLDRRALTRRELVEVELAVFDSRLFGSWNVVDAVRRFERQKTDSGEDDWDPHDLLNVLGKEIRSLYNLEDLGPTKAHPGREDLSDYLPTMWGLIGSAGEPDDEEAEEPPSAPGQR